MKGGVRGCLSLVSELLQSHRWSDHVRLKLTENETQETCHLFQKEMLLGWVMGENPLWRKIVAHGTICEVQLFWKRKEKARAVCRCGGGGGGKSGHLFWSTSLLAIRQMLSLTKHENRESGNQKSALREVVMFHQPCCHRTLTVLIKRTFQETKSRHSRLRDDVKGILLDSRVVMSDGEKGAALGTERILSYILALPLPSLGPLGKPSRFPEVTFPRGRR